MNMKRGYLGVAVALLAGAALAVAGIQEYSLKRTAKQGEVFKYKMSGELDVMGQSVGMSAILINKTTKVEANGNYVVESSQSEGKITINGSDMDLPSQGSTITTYKPDGTVLDVQGEGVEMGGYRMANLLSTIMSEKSLKVGDEWTSETKGDTKKSTVDVKGAYKFVALEKIESGEAAKITFEMKEQGGDTPGAISGTAWVELKTGNMVKMESTWKDVPVPGAPTPISGKVNMVLLP